MHLPAEAGGESVSSEIDIPSLFHKDLVMAPVQVPWSEDMFTQDETMPTSFGRLTSRWKRRFGIMPEHATPSALSLVPSLARCMASGEVPHLIKSVVTRDRKPWTLFPGMPSESLLRSYMREVKNQTAAPPEGGFAQVEPHQFARTGRGVKTIRGRQGYSSSHLLKALKVSGKMKHMAKLDEQVVDVLDFALPEEGMSLLADMRRIGFVSPSRFVLSKVRFTFDCACM